MLSLPHTKHELFLWHIAKALVHSWWEGRSTSSREETPWWSCECARLNRFLELFSTCRARREGTRPRAARIVGALRGVVRPKDAS